MSAVRGLDRAWAADETISSHGVRLRLRATERSRFEGLLELLPWGWKPAPGGGSPRVYSLVVGDSGKAGTAGQSALFADETELIRTRSFDRIHERFEAASRMYIAEMAPRRTFVHAGVVGWRGQAILLPGIGEAGKTTLTAALVRAGAGYLSDEYALIDDRGRVHPFPKPLLIRKRPGGLAYRLPIEAIGGEQVTKPLPVGLVVFTSYGAQRWRPRRLSHGEAILALLRHTMSAQQRPKEALDRLGRVVATAPVLKGGRGEADDAAGRILQRLEAVAGRS